MHPTSFARQIALVFNRTTRDGLHNFPLAFVAPTLLAGFVAVIFAAVFNDIASTPGFPADTFLDWIAPATVLLTAFVGAGYAASALLRDIQTGYLDRMRLLPIHPAALVIGRAGFEAVRIIPPATIVLAGSLAFGAQNRRGVPGFAAVIAITVVVAVMWNGIFFLTAIRTQNPAAVLGLQPLFMPIIMFSTFFAPTNGTPTWFKTIVATNPFTTLLNGTRSLLNGAGVGSDLAIGIGAFVAIGVLTYALSAGSYSGIVRPD